MENIGIEPSYTPVQTFKPKPPVKESPLVEQPQAILEKIKIDLPEPKP